MRFTKNNVEPDFTDQELLTVYLFSVGFERRFRIKDIYEYIVHHWLAWFPDLPSYQAFNARLNRLASAFPVLLQHLVDQYSESVCPQELISLTDSMPIITCSGKRQSKVASELCDKGYNATKNMYYFGVNLHSIGFHRPGKLPCIEFLQLTPASEHDLQAQRQILEQMPKRCVFGDKAFSDQALKEHFAQAGGELLTPVKYKKGQTKQDKQRHKAADDLYSKMVSQVRQPIESLFSWIIEHTDIQTAAKVRSHKGLLVHIFGKIAAALISLTTIPAV